MGCFIFHLDLLTLPSWKPPIFYPANTSCFWFSSYLSDPSWNSVADTSSLTRLHLWAASLYVQLTTWHTDVGRTVDCRVARANWTWWLTNVVGDGRSRCQGWLPECCHSLRSGTGKWGKWASYSTSFRNFPQLWFLPTEPFRRMRQQAEGWGFFPSKKVWCARIAPQEPYAVTMSFSTVSPVPASHLAHSHCSVDSHRVTGKEKVVSNSVWTVRDWTRTDASFLYKMEILVATFS